MRDEACAGDSAPARPGGPADDDSVTTEGGTRPARGSARLRGAAWGNPHQLAGQRTLGQSHVLQDHAVHVHVDGEGSLVWVEDARLVERLHDS